MLLDINGIKEIIPHRYPFPQYNQSAKMDSGVG